ncbi:MAG: VTT domain-containing protein [Terricaulis silvestris]
MNSSPQAARWRLARFLPGLVILAALAAVFAFHLLDWVSFDTLSQRRAELDAFVRTHLLEALAVFVALYIAAVAVSLPVSIYFSIAGGFLFGTWAGGAASWVASVIGAVLLFLAVRSALGDVLRRHAAPWLARFEDGFRANAFNYILALRLTPLAPFWMVNLASALLEVRPRDYVLATLLGIIPTTFVYCSIGAALHAALLAGETLDPLAAAKQLVLSPVVLLPLLGLITLSLAPVLIRRLRARLAG